MAGLTETFPIWRWFGNGRRLRPFGDPMKRARIAVSPEGEILHS
ncbi:hypothetical protein [Nocardioides glacieisoli]|nr:hypothetical protein [Nocardioides glacieisoli]